MKLKEIPQNTVVHTPTEAEAKELLAILHENGWTWNIGQSLIEKTRWHNAESCYCLYPDGLHVTWSTIFDKNFLTLAEFKDKYCEKTEQLTEKAEENSVIRQKPQPRFAVGDKVRFEYSKDSYSRMCEIKDIRIENGIVEYQIGSVWAKEPFLEPYTEPETKPTEDMETNKLNLCELLKGHEGEYFYSPYLGECKLDEIKPDEDHNQIWLRTDNGVWVALPSCGHEPDGFVMLYPSRALYVQYPLDAYAAWMKWKEEPTIFHIRIEFQPYDERGEMKCGNMGTLHFNDLKLRTASDRDKCIEEIKEKLKEYSN